MNVFVKSGTGLVREQNEDAVFAFPEVGVFGVADGMGGGNEGETASRMVADVVQSAMADTAGESPGMRKYTFQQALHRVNAAIREYAQARHYSVMGSTVAAMLADPWHPARAFVCHVGDSRIYRLRAGKLERLTADHTLGNELATQTGDDSVNVGRVTHLLTRALGMSGRIRPEWRVVDLRPGDRLLVCTDGVHGMIDDAAVAAGLAAADPADELERVVLAAGARDNYSLVVAEIGELPETDPRTAAEEQESDYLMKIAEERIDV